MSEQAMTALHVAEIIDLWYELLGLDPVAMGAIGAEAQRTEVNWETRRVLEPLSRAQALDPSNALFLMLLEDAVDAQLAARSIDARSFNADPAPFLSFAELGKRLKKLIQESGMPEVREDLRQSVVAALRHYGAGERPAVMDLVRGTSAIAYLWRDALDAMDRQLEIHQFLQGPTETQKPVYQTRVLGFWSLNDALRICTQMPSGVSLCLIRDREAVHSFFAFVIRNGGTLSVVTDRTPWTHPLQKRQSRRPDRHLDERWAKARFPYELLNIENLTDEEGEVVGLNVPREEGLVPHQTRAYKLMKIEDLAPDVIVWIAMMFALMNAKFFRESWQAPALSYTGEMVQIPHLLEAAAEAAQLPAIAGSYKTLRAAPLASGDLTTPSVQALARTRQSTGHHNWMEERYAHLVEAGYLNRVAAPQDATTFLLENGDIERAADTRLENWRTPEPGRRRIAALEDLDATSFGTAEQLLADRAFIARLNQARLIGHYPQAEFERREKDVIAWWAAVMVQRKSALFDAVRAGSFAVDSDARVASGFSNVLRGHAEILTRCALGANGAICRYQDFPGTDTVVIGQRQYRDGRTASRWRCGYSGRPAQSFAVFAPQVADDLAALAGVSKEDLPDVLQHWTGSEPYVGNSILQRIDPLEWAVKNPWSKLRFKVFVFLSDHVFPEHAPPAGGQTK